MAAPAVLGDLLPNESQIYRAFTARGFLNESKTAILDRAYLRKKKDDDGLSFGLTAERATSNLTTHGVCEIGVGNIHGLEDEKGHSRGLEARIDLELEGHALLHGLPFVEDDRPLAEAIAWELVEKSRIVHTNFHKHP